MSCATWSVLSPKKTKKDETPKKLQCRLLLPQLPARTILGDGGEEPRLGELESFTSGKRWDIMCLANDILKVLLLYVVA